MNLIKTLETPAKNTWCPGCGNFGILAALKAAISDLGLDNEEIVVVTGIGCHGKLSDYINTNSIHVIHGRVIPVAMGVKIANPRLTVIGHAGDGDAYAIGIGHLPHAARRNIDIIYIVHNNMVFGLTTGQVTPTSPRGLRTRSTPFGNPEEPMNPVLLALTSGATFVARGFSGNVRHLTYLMKEAIRHRGFAFIDVLQPCVTFYNTYKYLRERTYELETAGHDPSDYDQALRIALHSSKERIPIGIIYKVRKPMFLEAIRFNKPLVDYDRSNVSLSRILNTLR